MEQKIISAACAARESFEELIPYVDKETFSDKGTIIFKEIKSYYHNDENASCVDKDILLNRLVRAYPKAEDVFKVTLQNEYSVSPRNVVKELKDMQLMDVKADLQAAFSVHGNDDAIDKLLDRYQSLIIEKDIHNEEAVVYNSRNLSDIYDTIANEHRIRLFPAELQAATGGALKKHHIIIYARPDGGKSTFAGELIAGFLEQNLKVLYFSNEDPPDDLMSRFISRILKKPIAFVQQNRERAWGKLLEKNWEKFWFVELRPGNLKEIEEKVKEIQPDVILVDQLRNLETKAEGRTRELEICAQGIRNIAKRHDLLAVSFTQAGDSAEGKALLNRSDVDSSKTGIQSTADLMIGIGATQEDEQNGVRWLSYPKNKLSGNKTPSRVKIDFSIFKVGS